MMNHFEWQTIELPKTRKTADWYWAFWIITLALMVVAVFLESYVFALFILIAGFSLSLIASRPSEEIVVSVDQNGITFGSSIVPFNQMRSFYIIERRTPVLVVRTQQLFYPMITHTIDTEAVDIDELRAFLAKRVHQQRMHEPVMHHLFNHLGL
jgi:hypothetical protein